MEVSCVTVSCLISKKKAPLLQVFNLKQHYSTAGRERETWVAQLQTGWYKIYCWLSFFNLLWCCRSAWIRNAKKLCYYYVTFHTYCIFHVTAEGCTLWEEDEGWESGESIITCWVDVWTAGGLTSVRAERILLWHSKSIKALTGAACQMWPDVISCSSSTCAVIMKWSTGGQQTCQLLLVHLYKIREENKRRERGETLSVFYSVLFQFFYLFLYFDFFYYHSLSLLSLLSLCCF